MTPELKRAIKYVNDHRRKFSSAMMRIERDTLDVTAASNHLGISRSAVLAAVKRGELSGAKVGNEYRITDKSLDAYAKSRITKVS